MIGATNPVEAVPGSIRGDFALEVTFNLVHGSDSDPTAEREIGLWFPELHRLTLASRSPQRRAILEQLGIPFDVRPADVDEDTDGDPAEVVTRTRRRKARAVAGRTVLGVDTEVYLDGRLFGKPADDERGAPLPRAALGRAPTRSTAASR